MREDGHGESDRAHDVPDGSRRRRAPVDTAIEGLVVRDLRVHTQAFGRRSWHRRDSNQNETDVIITVDDGRWGACEAKTNPAAVVSADESLLRFAAKIDTARTGEPSFLAVDHSCTRV